MDCNLPLTSLQPIGAGISSSGKSSSFLLAYDFVCHKTTNNQVASLIERTTSVYIYKDINCASLTVWRNFCATCINLPFILPSKLIHDVTNPDAVVEGIIPKNEQDVVVLYHLVVTMLVTRISNYSLLTNWRTSWRNRPFAILPDSSKKVKLLVNRHTHNQFSLLGGKLCNVSPEFGAII